MGKQTPFYSDVLTVKTIPEPTLTGAWKEIGLYNQASYSSFLTVGNKQYWVSSANTYEVEPLTSALTKKANFPGTASGSISLVSTGQKIYLLSGLDKSLNFVRETWEYDIAGNTWTRKADFPGNIRQSPCAASVGGKVYYGLGSVTTNLSTYFTDWWEFDPTTDRWTQKKDHPDQTNGNAAFGVNNKLYLIAASDNSQSFASRRVYEYDPATNGWKRLKDAPEGELKTQRKVTCLVNNKIYALQNTSTYGQFWEYDAPTDTWAERQGLGTIVSQGKIFPYNNKIYLIGSALPSYATKLFEFTP